VKGPSPSTPPAEMPRHRLLDRHALCQVPRHVHVVTQPNRDFHRQQLTNDHHFEELQHRVVISAELDNALGQQNASLKT
jgi:hypothetical protein